MRITWLALFLFAPLHAMAAEPYARAAVEDAGAIVAGQQIHVAVDVFAPNFFTSPPLFPLFELPNALVTLPEERTLNLNVTTDGIEYSGIRRRYAVVPQIPGDYQVPPIDIDLGYSVDGAAVQATVTTAPFSFSVGGDGIAPATFAARNVTVEQAFDRPPSTLKAGDAVVRTISISAEDAQAIIIPPTNPGTAAGLPQYAKAAKTQDGIAVDRRTVSRRTETLVYTAVTEGTFIIPAIEYPWFDLDRHAMTVAHLPATDVSVSPASTTSGIAPDAGPQHVVPLFERRRQVMLRIGLFLAAVAMVWVLWHFAKVARRRLLALRQHMIASRRYRLRQLRRSILHGDPSEVYRALQAWSQLEGFRTLHHWVASHHPDLAVDIRGLEELMYSGRHGNFDRRRMARLVNRDSMTPHHSIRHALPELNPTR
ncbi:Oxygen tolerance [Rhizobium sp. NFR07]|uniref:BatD family protein n=1 Tax=Rhizobium sp. NFR07 TaxID=1566262 RepID=UPI0008F16A63|nr:BatD family protein [Rhizobium sp. NFR07]SFB32555.1 Oxygen tolerance [Rhizobium sp. NFR07]